MCEEYVQTDRYLYIYLYVYLYVYLYAYMDMHV